MDFVNHNGAIIKSRFDFMIDIVKKDLSLIVVFYILAIYRVAI